MKKGLTVRIFAIFVPPKSGLKVRNSESSRDSVQGLLIESSGTVWTSSDATSGGAISGGAISGDPISGDAYVNAFERHITISIYCATTNINRV